MSKFSQKLTIFSIINLLLGCTLKSNSELCSHCENNQCTKCIKSFIKNGQCTLPNYIVENCLEYIFDGKCMKCEPTFYLKDNKCIKIHIDNCYKGTENFCEECLNGIKAINGKCDQNNKCKIQNCEICKENFNGDEICEMCQENFVREMINIKGDYKCIPQNENTKHCMTLNPMDKKKCLNCRINFFDNHWNCNVSAGYHISAMSFSIIGKICLFYIALFLN